MNVHCPNCQTLFRVDPARVPEDGVRTRCSSCQAVFRLGPDGVIAAAPAPAAATPVAPAPEPPSAPATEPEVPSMVESRAPSFAQPEAPAAAEPEEPAAAEPEEPSMAEAEPPSTPEPEPAPPAPAPEWGTVRPPEPAAATQPAPAEETSLTQPRPAPSASDASMRPTPVFGRQDPDTRAQRIARALVSDMVVYNADRRDRSLAAGTLRVDFKEEILKSWEEYVEQVGQEMAKKSPHFRNALNSILAQGQQIF